MYGDRSAVGHGGRQRERLRSILLDDRPGGRRVASGRTSAVAARGVKIRRLVSRLLAGEINAELDRAAAGVTAMVPSN